MTMFTNAAATADASVAMAAAMAASKEATTVTRPARRDYRFEISRD